MSCILGHSESSTRTSYSECKHLTSVCQARQRRQYDELPLRSKPLAPGPGGGRSGFVGEAREERGHLLIFMRSVAVFSNFLGVGFAKRVNGKGDGNFEGDGVLLNNVAYSFIA